MSGDNRGSLRAIDGGTGRRESVLQRRLTLSDMLDAPTFTEVVKSFVELYRVGIKVFDEHGNKLADIKIGNGDFCGYVFSFPEGRQPLHRDRGAGEGRPARRHRTARAPTGATRTRRARRA